MSFDTKSLELFQKRVDDFYKNFGEINKRSRSKDWQPVRFAIRDHVVGFVDSKHQFKENVLEVDVFLTEDPEWINGYGGTKLAILYLLSEAYQCGSTMGIKFTKDVEGGTIPTNIIDVAEQVGIELKNIAQGFITPKESRFLYLALTGFSPIAIRRIKELSVTNTITPERICYLVNHGVWTLEEMETIILGYQHPELVLGGDIDILDYLDYSQALSIARSAVLNSFLDRKLRLKEILEGDNAIDVEANDRKFNVTFDSRFFAKEYQTLEETPIPWTVHQELTVPSNNRLVVVTRDYDWSSFYLNFQRDLEAFKKMTAIYQDSTPTRFFVLVPRDVFNAPEEFDLDIYRQQLEEIGFDLMVCPELLVMLDDDIQKRFQQMAVMRHDVPVGQAAKRDVIIKKIPSIYNSPTLKVVKVPIDFQDGLTVLSKLISQHYYDQVELIGQVNRKNVENRFHRVYDMIIYVGKTIAINQPEGTIVFTESFIEELSDLKLTKMVYPYASLSEDIIQIKNCQFSDDDFQQSQKLINLLEQAQLNQQNVILFVDRYSESDMVVIPGALDDDELEAHFKGQFVLDRVIDFSDKDVYQVADQIVWNGVNSAKVGRANAVNLSELPHNIITETLNRFVYREVADSNFPISINVVYTDGSKARPFPLCRLKKRPPDDMVEIRNLTPIKKGMMSCRHAQMDRILDSYWFRNIDINRCGRSSAEKDEYAYQTTKKRLSEITKNNQPIRIEFYQTGFEPVVIGFYRAVTEFLIESEGLPPLLEVIPKYFNGDTNYKKGTVWC